MNGRKGLNSRAYSGMVSLVQMTVASVAGYTFTILGASSITAISLFWPWWVAAPLAIAVAVLFGTFAGILSARTEGIYTIMITLAIAAAFFYLTLQNYAIFNGFNGFTRIPAPKFWGIDWNKPVPLYYSILFFAALGYVVVLYISRAPFGLALQGVRDNPRRMEAIGYNVTAHRVAAYAFAALIAGIGGILMVWLNHQISPGTAGIQATIYLLVVSGLLLSFGRLGDLRGNKTVYVWGFLIFVLGSAFSGLSPAPGFLISSRAFQALGATMLFANSPAILTKTFPAEQRGQALAPRSANPRMLVE